MDFSIIDPHTNAVFQQILSRIRRLQSGGTIDSLQDIGANTDHQIGASYVSLKELAATYPPDENWPFCYGIKDKEKSKSWLACFSLKI